MIELHVVIAIIAILAAIHLMMARSLSWLALLAICSGAPAEAADAGRPLKPNLVLILTDDLGWQDVGCYDIDAQSPMETPNIDAFAKQGVLFWQAYAPSPVCSPSRCAIMSGKHPARVQKTNVLGGAPPHPIHKTGSRMLDPWYSGRMSENELTLPKVLRQHGYVTGHSGKWHMAIDHHAFPQPEDQGFDYTRSSRGSRSGMKPDRLTGFATTAPDDPYRLDANGYPFDQTNEDALAFLRAHKHEPFFLYYASWLVHAPIYTLSKARLEKYSAKLGVDPAHLPPRGQQGQNNPFYCAMVEEMDYYVGTIFKYLQQTDDPRWPGHKLSENTYVIFTSDNGGMEGEPNESYTDNYPLDQGKIHLEEGGTRVPLIIAGPGVPAGVQSDVMVNGLDIYPTLLTLAGVENPREKQVDGCDLAALLKNNPTDPALVQAADGSARDTMMWHYPHGAALESSIRVGDWKLIRKYDHVANPAITNEWRLFRLYKTTGGRQVRDDIEEAKDLAQSMPDKTKEMSRKLMELLNEMDANYPHYNPASKHPLPGKDKVPVVISFAQQSNKVELVYEVRGAKVAQADLIYTTNGGQRYEEWFRTPATILPAGKITAEIPRGTTHFVLNLIDENNFLVSYPEIDGEQTLARKQAKYSDTALKVVLP